jgi:DNA polymerase III sliding clamp (beta) subunit (PCNA family)
MKIEIPKVNRRMLDCVRFVARAVSKDNSRYAIQNILVEKGRFVATDGKRLHIADIQHDFEPGMYEVVVCNQSRVVLLKIEDGHFPKYQDIIPERKSYFEANDAYGEITIAMKIIYGLAAKLMMHNPKFIHEAAVGNDWKVYYGEPDRPILLVSKTGKRAVIMPITPPIIHYETS